MADTTEEFEQKLFNAVAEKQVWFDTVALKKIQEDYRLHLTCVSNLIDVMQKKALIQPDPYKKEKKISNIVCPENTDFNENERAMIMGIRLSDYESMVDFVCNYMHFSVEMLGMDQIKKLVELNNAFNWSNLSLNSTKPNTKGLGYCINQLKASGVPLTLALVNDALVNTNRALEEINVGLKQLAVFQRERYKVEVRQKVIHSPQFDKEKANSSGALLLEIKRLFPSCMGKRAFSAELIGEIIQENTAGNREELRSRLLKSLIVEEDKPKKKEESVDTHGMLMEAVKSLGALSDQYEIVLNKMMENHDILENSNTGFFKKLMSLFRQMFGGKAQSVEYEVVFTDKQTGTKRKEKIDYNQFVDNLSKRSKYYTAIALKNTQTYAKINAQKDDAILEFLNKQITENSRLQIVLGGLDEYFKNNAPPSDKSRIKGIKMELTSLKNSIVRINQQRAEYVSFMEEQKQMKKLGVAE